MELYIYMIGLISNRLFEGANHVMYKYCEALNNDDYSDDNVNMAIQNLEYSRVYIRYFLILLNKTIGKIVNDLNVDVRENFFLNSMVRNLSEMIGITTISNYRGENDFDKMITMKNRIQTVYDMTDKVCIPGVNLIELKSHIASSVLLMDELLDWLKKRSDVL